jgi:hypothetical protein
MPAGNKKSRGAIQKREEGRTTFAKHAARPPSPNKSDYCASTSDDDLDTDDSATDIDDDDDGQRNQEAETSVIALQRLYAVFLPPHLRPNQFNQASVEKRRKITNRPVIYTGGSRTTAWRRDVAQTKAAQGCATLDGFIQRKVGNRMIRKTKCLMHHDPQKRQHNSSPIEEDPVEVPNSGNISRASTPDSEIESVAQSTSPAVNEQGDPSHAVTQARSLEDLSAARPEEDVARSAADGILAHVPSPVDELTAELAKLCLDQLEKHLMLDNEVHEVGGANEFEEELRVRFKSKPTCKGCACSIHHDIGCGDCGGGSTRC